MICSGECRMRFVESPPALVGENDSHTRWTGLRGAGHIHLANDLNSKTCYRAACTAASVGAGRGQDAVGLDESEWLRWRIQARDWLRADLDLSRKLIESNAVGPREFLKHTLRTWLTDPDLEGLRDPAACKGLLPSEQQEFRTLCEDLRILIKETKN